jgi:peptidoglycan-associated lipoprotein
MKPNGSRVPKKTFTQKSKRILFYTLILIVPFGMMAFNPPLRDAEHERARGNYYAAIENYDKALGQKMNKSDRAYVFFQRAECKRLTLNWQGALKDYDKAIKSGYQNDIAFLRRADAYRYIGRYDLALADYEEYQKRVPNDPAGANGIASCELATKWQLGANGQGDCNSSWWTVKNEAELNTRDMEFCPSWSDKKHTSLFITSKRAGQTGSKIDPVTGLLYCDIFESRKSKNASWSIPQPIAGDVNTAQGNEGATVINKSGNKMYFTRCDQAKNKEVTCKIFSADKQGNGWSKSTVVDFSLDAAVLDSFNFRHPALSANGEVMIFSSDLTGSKGLDLWMSVYDNKTKKWGKPTRLGNDVNTDGKEAFPYIHEDGTLYFASDGHPGMGGLDIFSATKDANAWSWRSTENMKYPLNSSADDFGLIMAPDKRSGYLTSSREGTKGGDDIWSFAVSETLCPMKMTGKVVDQKNKIPVENATVHVKGSDGSMFDLLTNADGSYGFKMKLHTSYEISIEGKSGHSSMAEAYFNLPSNENPKFDSPDGCPCTVDIVDSIIPIEPKEIKFPAVLYEYNSAALTGGSTDSLDYLYRLLMDNPTLVIELGSHTDCRGNDNYNRELSQRRAQACVDYLVKTKGIPRERIVAKGYGESQPFYLDSTTVLKEDWIKKQPKDKQEYYHQLNRRTVFRVLNYNYAPKGQTGDLPKEKPPVVKKGFFDASEATWEGGEIIEETPEKDDN